MRFSMLVLLLLMIGCGPARVEQFVEVGPNETAFLVPLEDDAEGGQGKFDSVEFLNKSKIATKRFSLPLREVSTGKWPGDYKYIPTAKVITVDRSPVTMELTQGKDTGTSKKNQCISAESIESIGFCVGVIVTAMVTEEDAALFLFRFAGKELAYIVDMNIRASMAEYLSSRFGQMTLDEIRTGKTQVFADMATAVRSEYKALGITITTIGSSEGISYDDVKIQNAINDAWSAEREKERADVEALTKKVRATAEATAAIEVAKGGAEAALLRAQGEAKALIARAKGEAESNKTRSESLTPFLLAQLAIEKWDGSLPAMIGGTTPQLVTEVKNYIPTWKGGQKPEPTPPFQTIEGGRVL